MRHSLPTPYPIGNCVLISVDVGLLPILTSQILPLLQARLWEVESFQTGYYAISEVLSQMTNSCITQLVQEIRDFRGVKPDFASTPVEERTSDMYNSLNDSFAQLLALRGIMNDGWFEDTYTTLKDLTQVNRGNNQAAADDTWQTVADLIGGGAEAGDVLANVGTLLENTAETAAEVGLLTALIAIEASNAMLLNTIIQSQVPFYNALADILTALRGETAPSDNILQALRGVTPSDADRNIAELLT